MQHAIELDALRSEVGDSATAMANAVSACVHCGFCLPTCPTYIELGEEMDSPRGRIVLMKEVLEGGLDLEEALVHIDPCLGCMSCVTACPSGVEYGELLMPFRELAEAGRRRSLPDRLWRGLMLDTLARPARLRWMLRLGRLAAPFRVLLPARLAATLDLLPRTADRAEVGFGVFPAMGERRARVALLAGCAQQVLAPRIHRATIEVLTRRGVEVVVPKEEACCGSLALHAGDAPRARAAAGSLLQVFGPEGLLADVDAVLTNAAGCGSGLKEYGLLFAGRPEEAAARALAAKVRDVSTFLAALETEAPPPLPQPMRVAYHDACHLAHAQSERTGPRQLLAQVSGRDPGRTARLADLLRFGGHLQPGRARARGAPGAQEGGGSARGRTGRDRHRQHRLPDPDREPRAPFGLADSRAAHDGDPGLCVRRRLRISAGRIQLQTGYPGSVILPAPVDCFSFHADYFHTWMTTTTRIGIMVLGLHVDCWVDDRGPIRLTGRCT